MENDSFKAKLSVFMDFLWQHATKEQRKGWRLRPAPQAELDEDPDREIAEKTRIFSTFLRRDVGVKEPKIGHLEALEILEDVWEKKNKESMGLEDRLRYVKEEFDRLYATVKAVEEMLHEGEEVERETILLSSGTGKSQMKLRTKYLQT